MNCNRKTGKFGIFPGDGFAGRCSGRIAGRAWPVKASGTMFGMKVRPAAGRIFGCSVYWQAGLPIVAIFLFVGMVFGVLYAERAHAAGETVRHVAITQIVEHPALDACRRGIEDVLAENGYRNGENLKISFENAQGNSVTNVQIARKLVGLGPDVIVAISTPSAQAVAASTRTIPLVFAAVTDPVGARLVRQWRKPGGNVTGVSDMLPLDAHLQMIRRAMPKLKRLGVVYNPGEANSVSLLAMLKKQAPAFGFSIHEASATRSGEVLQAARSLVGKVGAFYVFTDNTVVSALEAVVKVGRDAQIPVFAGDTASVRRGAVAAMGFDYYQAGRQTGEMVVRILRGARPGDIDVARVGKLDLFVNPASARSMGLELPQELISSARKIIGSPGSSASPASSR